MQQNLDVMGENGCQNRIQRPKNIENDHTHQLCISKKISATQCNQTIPFCQWKAMKIKERKTKSHFHTPIYINVH